MAATQVHFVIATPLRYVPPHADRTRRLMARSSCHSNVVHRRFNARPKVTRGTSFEEPALLRKGRRHEGGIRPSRVVAICPARLPARRPSPEREGISGYPFVCCCSIFLRSSSSCLRTSPVGSATAKSSVS